MADNHDLLILPNREDASIVLSESRSSLAARGRNDAAALMGGKPKTKLSAATYYVGKSGQIDRNDAFTQFQIAYAYQNGQGVPQDYT